MNYERLTQAWKPLPHNMLTLTGDSFLEKYFVKKYRNNAKIWGEGSEPTKILPTILGSAPLGGHLLAERYVKMVFPIISPGHGPQLGVVSQPGA